MMHGPINIKVNSYLLNSLPQVQLFHRAVSQNSRPPQQTGTLTLTSTGTDKRLTEPRPLFARVIYFESPDGVISIVTTLWAGRSGIRISAQTSAFFSSKSTPAVESIKILFNGNGGYFLGGKAART